MPTIYHYTDGTGLTGILDSGVLWASDALYLNDASELQYGIDLGYEVIEDILSTIDAPASVAEAILTRGIITRGYETDISTFVTCFCAEGDLLSQWRGYAGGIGGYSIGFDTDRLRAVASNSLFNFQPIIYSPADQRAIFEATLRTPINAVVASHGPRMDAFAADLRSPEGLRRQTEPNGDAESMPVVAEVWAHLQFHATSMKAEAFQSEQEQRLVRTIITRMEEIRPYKIDFHSRGPLLIPHIELDAKEPDGKLPITSVMHGPTPHPDLTAKTLRLLLRKYGYPPDLVVGSKIPLRA